MTLLSLNNPGIELHAYSTRSLNNPGIELHAYSKMQNNLCLEIDTFMYVLKLIFLFNKIKIIKIKIKKIKHTCLIKIKHVYILEKIYTRENVY